ESDESAIHGLARLLEELSPCRAEEVLVWLNLSLGDGPRSRVLLRPEGSTGMAEEHFKLPVLVAIEEQAGAVAACHDGDLLLSCALRARSEHEAACSEVDRHIVVLEELNQWDAQQLGGEL